MSYLSIGLTVCLLTLVWLWLLVPRGMGLATSNERPPRLGGLALAVATLLVALLATRLPVGSAHRSAAGLIPVLAGGSLIGLIGWFDDRRTLSPLVKLFGQIVAASVTYALGLSVGFIEPGWGNGLLTVFCLVGGANALNLIDGVDGLAGGVAMIAAGAAFALARNAGHIDAAVLAAALAGGSLAFLWFNLPPARVYLGDAGSNFLGFCLAALPLLMSSGGRGFEHFSAVMLLLAVPIVETATTIGRRVLAGRNPLLRDRKHIHHRLLRQGWTIGAVLGLAWGITAGLAAIVLLAGGTMTGLDSTPRTILTWSLLLGLLVISSFYVGRHGHRFPTSSKR
ncbi:MAG: MraY family glycosyltransferase [Candidatus Eisenbacteria bacterium]|nr:MraY family glycosyltransferase [Candidatus Eisenbacteria bacterium]